MGGRPGIHPSFVGSGRPALQLPCAQATSSSRREMDTVRYMDTQHTVRKSLRLRRRRCIDCPSWHMQSVVQGQCRAELHPVRVLASFFVIVFFYNPLPPFFVRLQGICSNHDTSRAPPRPNSIADGDDDEMMVDVVKPLPRCSLLYRPIYTRVFRH